MNHDLPIAGAPDQNLGKYRLLEVLHTGPMSTVYRAVDSSLGRDVAIKVLASHLTADAESVGRFLNEARLVSRMRHPNIITIYDVDIVAGRHFIVMELLHGPTLARQIPAGTGLAPERVCRIMRQLADALDYAHAQGLVHRDIKPANIAVDDTDHVTLMDFGLVKGEFGTRLTQVGTTLGTPAYMSPEQVQGQDATSASDVYSLGAVAFEMLAGRLPFDRESSTAIMYAHVHEAPPAISSVVGGMNRLADQALMRAMAKVPHSRWSSAGALATALCKAIHTPPLLAMPFPGVGLSPLIAGVAGALVVIGLLVTAAPSIRVAWTAATADGPGQAGEFGAASPTRQPRDAGDAATASITDTPPPTPLEGSPPFGRADANVRPTPTRRPPVATITAVVRSTVVPTSPTQPTEAPPKYTEPASEPTEPAEPTVDEPREQPVLPPIGGQAPPTPDRPPPSDPPTVPPPPDLP